VPDLI